MKLYSAKSRREMMDLSTKLRLERVSDARFSRLVMAVSAVPVGRVERHRSVQI